MKKLKITLGLTALFINNVLFAANQSLGLQNAAESFWDEIRGAAKYIIAGIFLVSILFNIGKVTGGDRDYKGFFIGLGLFFFSLVLIVAVISYILSLSF